MISKVVGPSGLCFYCDKTFSIYSVLVIVDRCGIGPKTVYWTGFCIAIQQKV